MKNLTNVLCRKLGYLDYLSQWPAYFSLIALFTLGASLSLNAQCIDCITTDVENPYEVFIDSTCNVTIKASDLQTDLAACEDLNIRVEDLQGFLVEQGVNEITMEAGFYTDSTLVVIMESPDDISICSAFISLKDTIAPVIEVDDMELFCGVDTCADKLGYPVVIDNCGMIASLSYRDSIIEEGCVGTYSLRFVRIWTALDRVGNTKMAEQNIDLKRADLDDVVFPADVKLSCEEAEVSPENLGWPTVEGDRLDQGVFCNFTVTFEDSETDICSGIGYEIERSWTVKDECSGTSRTFLQSIKVSDDVKPEMQCPQEIVVETDGGKCYATVNLPQPIVYDNCDSEVMLAATTTYGGMGFEEHNLVPKGLHIVHYSAIDKCGNVSKCSVRMIVEDNEQPTAVADEYTVVAIPNGGLARVRANTFDSGSHDNCSGDIYFKARRMDEGSCDWANGDDSGEPGQQEWFDDYLYFCCEDVNQSIVVIMRVYDVDPGDGPIDPDREGPGGDLQGHYTDAMIIVEIQDKIPPRVEDLPDYVIDCTDDIENLARFGSPEIYDICGYALDSTVNYELNDCGTGYIERIFTATDLFGNEATTIQRITVANKEPFNEDQIIWPADIQTTNCLSQTRPADLPLNFREPRFNDESCADLSIGYEDQVYQFNDGVSCYKIIRTWTVTDLCTYDARNPQAGGVFRRNQTIKVSDIIPPTLIIPNDTVVAVTNDCGSVEVTLPDAFDEDCYTGTTISTDSPFAETRGANASGIYPVGTTEIEFTAVDQCGNVTKRIMTITVEDRTAPEIRCKVNYSVDMEEVNGVIGVTVDAADVVLQATDNCTPFNELTFTIAEAGAVESVPEDLTMNFDCDDLGRKTVEIWSTDSNGNSSLCVTQIGINDDENVCPNNSTSQNGNDAPTPEEEGVIAGGILTEDGNTVEGVMVNVKSDSPFEFETGVDGEYAFYQMAFGKNYVVRPEKDDDVLAGISTLDLVVLAKHIAGTRPFDSPYKWVAGDVDGNGSVSTLDLIRLRKLILNLADNLPNNQKSWRFIDADYVFEDFKNPLSSEYPTQKTIYGLSGDEMHMDFIGVKVGDVNGSATPNSLLNFDRHNVQEPMLISTEDANVSRGSTFEVTLTGAELKEYLGYQFTLDFDPEKMSLLSIELGDLEGLTMENFGLSKIDQGLLMTNWFTPSAVSFNKNQELFTLTFEAYEDFKISEVLRLSSRLARAEAYDVNEQTSNVKLEFKNNGNVTLSENGFNLYQNQPNPFNDQTTIGFDLPAQTEVQFNVFDASGKLLFSNQENYPAGYNTLNIDANQLGTTGLLYYQLKTANFSATKKMVLIK